VRKGGGRRGITFYYQKQKRVGRAEGGRLHGLDSLGEKTQFYMGKITNCGWGRKGARNEEGSSKKVSEDTLSPAEKVNRTRG